MIGFVMFLLLHGYLLAKNGQTIGKRIVGIRIVSVRDGQLLTLGRVVALRYLPLSILGQIPVLGNILALINVLFIFRKDRRCMHDLIAGSKVVMVPKNT